jgi:hypothetical protein
MTIARANDMGRFSSSDSIVALHQWGAMQEERHWHRRVLPQRNNEGEYFMRMIMSVCAAGMFASAALAQTTPAPPVGPTKVQCDQGYKEGSQWTKEQFTAACDKLRQGQGR